MRLATELPKDGRQGNGGVFGLQGPGDGIGPPFPQAIGDVAEARKDELLRALAGVKGGLIAREELLSDPPVVSQIGPTGRELDNHPAS